MKTSLRQIIRDAVQGSPDRFAVVTENDSLTYSELLSFDDEGWLGGEALVSSSDALEIARTIVELSGRVNRIIVGAELEKARPSQLSVKTEQGSVPMVGQRIVGNDSLKSTALGSPREYLRGPGEISRGNYEMDRANETELVLQSSGTTGPPKRIVHSLSSFIANPVASKESSGSAEVWGQLYDISRFAGLQVLLLGLSRGAEVVVPPSTASFSERLHFLLDRRVSHLSATPTLWRRVLMSPEHRLLDLSHIVLGGEAADQATLDALRVAYPNAKITHTYASTEVGLSFWVSDGLEGFPVGFLEGGFDGVQAKIQRDRLFVRSKNAAKGYLEATFEHSDGFVDTGDIVAICGERFFVVGRENGSINVGGLKVWPDLVKSALLELEEVVDAFVYGRSNPITGEVVVADIVASDSATNTKLVNTIRVHCEERLLPHEVPRFLVFVDELEIGISGKARKKL